MTNAADFPDEVPLNTIVVCEVASITFGATRLLRGTGVVEIKRNVSILPGSNSKRSRTEKGPALSDVPRAGRQPPDMESLLATKLVVSSGGEAPRQGVRSDIVTTRDLLGQ